MEPILPTFIDNASDGTLASTVVAMIAPPKRAAATSFQLHAPLELLARAALLPHVSLDARHAARRQILQLGTRYAHEGETRAAVDRSFATANDAVAALRDALTIGDADTADAAIRSLLTQQSLDATLAMLRPVLVDHLGAAAHAPILVAELARVGDRITNVGELLRAPIVTLTKNLSQVRWHRTSTRPNTTRDPAQQLRARLGAPPTAHSATTSIAPTMNAVESIADEVLGDLVRALPPERAARELLRIAAWSMLSESTEHAPYGWTHCLTLPQAMLAMTRGTVDAAAGVAVAATYILGFRATLGRVALDPNRELPHGNDSDGRRARVASSAAAHEDAHFAKYTLACFDAAARDPDAAELYLRAAEHLATYWTTR